jgi:hypothetical protein
VRRSALAAVTVLCLVACDGEARPPAPATPAAPPAASPQARADAREIPDLSAALALAEGAVQVTRGGAGWTVRAHGASPFEVLTALGDAAGFRAERSPGAPEGAPLTIALEDAPLENALAAILAGLPHHVHYEFADGDLSPARPFAGREVVLARVRVGALAAPSAAATAARPPVDPGRRGPPPIAQRLRGAKGAVRENDPERARMREEADARESERAEQIARQWNDPRADVRLEAVELMAPEAEEDRGRLETLLADDPSPEVRAAAAETLAEGDAFEVMEKLLAALGDPDPSVVAAVVRGLEDVYDEAPNPRIRERVAELREHRDPSVREAVQAFEEWIEE